MEREIDARMQTRLSGFCGNLNDYFEKLETELENELTEFLYSIQISSSVKTDKYSLPFQDEVVIQLYSESYINGMFERDRIFRPIVKKLLELNAYKIRFYLHIETFGDGMKLFGHGIKYTFRYYIH